MSYSIATVQRSGSHYLSELLFQHTGLMISKYHEAQEDKMITITRDPYDVLCSQLTMELLYKDQVRSKEDIEELIEYNAQLAETFMDADVIINYEDLVLRPYETTKALAKIMNLKINSDTYKNRLSDIPEEMYLVSSKTNENYGKVRQIVKQFDLSRMYEVHNKMLLKAMPLDLF